MILIGKQKLLDKVSELLYKDSENRILINGIFDKELFSLINEWHQQTTYNPDIKVLLPHLRNQSLVFISYFLRCSKVMVNIKCVGKFILINDDIFFLSGSDHKASIDIKESDYIIQTQDNEAITQLLVIFMENWNQGKGIHF